MSLHIVLASGNRGKLAEFSSLLGERFRFSSQRDLNIEEVEETGLSFIENALIKARNASLHSQLPALADDSGLCVSALGGAPGIYSARFAGPGADDQANNAKLINELDGIDDRRAHFHCALVFVRHAEDPAPIICEGRWPGEIVDDPRGENGFGYDPHFFIPELGCCSAELPSQQKNRLSHRGRAVAQLIQRLQTEFPGS